jgi:UDP-GlcNAc:undecaprenyl-phosphate/decaprenyl-phosphate GlcNAc-1-phosphate transferase
LLTTLDLALVTGVVGLTVYFCKHARVMAARLGVVDMPDERKHHASATPLMGGIVLVLSVIPACLAASFLATSTGFPVSTILVWIACTAAMTLLGFADDRHTLSARDRLLVSLLVFGSACLVDPAFNVRVLVFGQPHIGFGLGTGWLSVIFSTVCFVGLVNAVNMADGKNGLVSGLCIGWLSILILRGPGDLHPYLFLLIAGMLPLFLFNLRGKLFLGDGGTYGFATAIGLMSVMVYNRSMVGPPPGLLADDIIAMFLVPVADSFRLTLVRLKRRQSPMTADRNHFHHILQDRFGWPGGLLIYHAIAFSLAFGWLMLADRLWQ